MLKAATVLIMLAAWSVSVIGDSSAVAGVNDGSGGRALAMDKVAVNGGVRLHYTTSGQGPLLILIHGVGDVSTTWDDLVPYLNGAFKVAVVDPRGYPPSDRPLGTEPYRASQQLGDIDQVIAAEGAKSATLVGHDIGAALAWRFAFAHPERVDALVVLGMPHPQAYARDLLNNAQQKLAYDRWKSQILSGTAPSLAESNWPADPGRRAAYQQRLQAVPLDTVRAAFAEADWSEPPANSKQPLNVPVLIIHGADDRIILPSGNDKTFAYVSNDSAYLLVPGAGHFVHHDKPAVVGSTISSWLDLHHQ